jgi:hypothetical protein
MDSNASLSVLSILNKRGLSSQTKLKPFKKSQLFQSKVIPNHRTTASYTSLIQERLKIVKKMQTVLYSDLSFKKIDYLRQKTPKQGLKVNTKLKSIHYQSRVVRIPRVTELSG